LADNNQPSIAHSSLRHASLRFPTEFLGGP
jgi:hypothetical protein